MTSFSLIVRRSYDLLIEFVDTAVANSIKVLASPVSILAALPLHRDARGIADLDPAQAALTSQIVGSRAAMHLPASRLSAGRQR
jgi:hypothetical protein